LSLVLNVPEPVKQVTFKTKLNLSSV